MSAAEVLLLLNGLLSAAANAGALLGKLQADGNRDPTPAEWDALAKADAAARADLVDAINKARAGG